MIEKEKIFEKQLLLCSAVLVIPNSMPINKHESQWFVARKTYYVQTNDTAFSVNWSVFCARILINNYRSRQNTDQKLSVTVHFSSLQRIYQSQNRSGGLELNSKVIDRWLYFSNFILSVEKVCYVQSNGQMVLPLWPLCQCLLKKILEAMNTFPDIFNCKGFEAQKRQTLNSI